jgi:hypothetical protein
VKSEGQSVDQPVLSTTFLGDTTQQVPPAVEETSSGIPEQGNLMLTTEGEEVARRASTELYHSSKREKVVAKGSSHQNVERRDRRSICITKGPGKCC